MTRAFHNDFTINDPKMAESSTDSGEMLHFLVVNKVNVCVCSCSQPYTVQGLIHQIKDMKDVVEEVKFKPLPYNIGDMDAFDFHGIDVLLLCHSINNRGFSLTDVPDALYDGFLPKARDYVGKSKVGVIAHDFPEEELTPENLASRMESFLNTQETTFRSSSLVLIGGNLSQAPIQLNQGQLNELKHFFRFASSPPPVEVVKVCLKRRGCMLCFPCALCCLRFPCSRCCRPRRDVGCIGFPVRHDDPPYTIN